MENASDAILMTGAILIFTIALTVAMTVFTQARVTADAVVYTSDATNYYEYIEADGSGISNREVGLETIIPTLYKYYKEKYTVVFLNKSGIPIILYENNTDVRRWTGDVLTASGSLNNTYLNKYYNKYSMGSYKYICSFDVDEEGRRREPWTGDNEETKKNLEAFLYGQKYYSPATRK